MVKRLFVFLFIFSIGYFVLACSQTSNAQTESPNKNASEETTSDPVTLKQDAPKKEASNQEASTQDASTQDASTQVAPKKVAPKKDAPKQDEPKGDATKKVEPTKDASKKDAPQDDSTKKDEPKKTDPQEIHPVKDGLMQDKEGSAKDVTSKDGSAKPTVKDGSKKVAPAKINAPTESEPTTAAPKLTNADEDPADDLESAPKLSSEQLLPPSTKLWVSIPDSKQLSERFDATQLGLLAKDEAIKPFIESFRQQLKDWVNGQNVRHGLDIDELSEIQSGEICIAGVLPELDGKQPGQAAHGIVLLVDISKTEQKAREILKKVNAELVKRGAKQESRKINGVECTKTTVNNPKRFRPNHSSFQAIVNGWMLVSDNELIFRGVLGRLVSPEKIKKTETLSDQPAFVEVMKRTDLGKEPAHIRWFVDPFGYLQLAQAVEAQDSANRVARDNWAGKLRNNGFDALQGVGGNISIATSKHEVLHRTFIHAPNDRKLQDTKHVFDLFDFSSGGGQPLTPAKWVPADCSSYFVANWNMSRALDGVGVIYDGFLEKGDFDRMLKEFRNDAQMQLDVHKLIGLLDNQLTVVSAVERPITETSERICIGIPITSEAKFIFESLVRATKGQVINLGGIDVIKVDSSVRDIDEEEYTEDVFQLPGAEIEEDEEEEPQFELFEKRFFVVHEGHLLIANNKDFLRKLMAQDSSKLSESRDYIEIKDAIGELTDGKKVSFRQFGRIDQVLETNYEMLRRGEMGKSQTVLARIMNQIFAKQAAEKAAVEGTKTDPDAIREQKLDGSKLPGDYAKSIAPYFGPTGWVMETEKDGWRITGCVLKKKAMTEVVQKVDGDENSHR